MDKNADGFEPGQELSFDDLARLRAKATSQAEPALTREDVGNLSRAELVELLETHGVEDPKGKMDDLRAQLIEVVFIE